MLSAFHHDRLSDELNSIEHIAQSLSFADGNALVKSLSNIRAILQGLRELSVHTDHIWNEMDWHCFPNGIVNSGDYTYLDQFTARYELVRRELLRQLETGASIELLVPKRAPIGPAHLE